VEALQNELQYFLECVASKKRPVNSGRAGLRVVKLLEAASQSLAKGGELVYL
jgi:predicted dehydrogenase